MFCKIVWKHFSLDLELIVFQCAYQSSTMLRRFDIVCRQAVISRNKPTQEVLSFKLGYSTITALRPKTTIEEF